MKNNKEQEFDFLAVPSHESFVIPLNFVEEHKKELDENTKNFLNKMKEMEESKKQMDLIDEEPSVFAVPCDRAWVVAPEKWEEFKNLKPDPELWKKVEEASKKLNIKVELEGPVLKKKINNK